MDTRYPRAILHVDGDSFFASVEQALDWRLRGKPVVTGGERGCATAMSYEAKKAGVRRSMHMREVKKITECGNVEGFAITRPLGRPWDIAIVGDGPHVKLTVGRKCARSLTDCLSNMIYQRRSPRPDRTPPS